MRCEKMREVLADAAAAADAEAKEMLKSAADSGPTEAEETLNSAGRLQAAVRAAAGGEALAPGFALPHRLANFRVGYGDEGAVVADVCHLLLRPRPRRLQTQRTP